MTRDEDGDVSFDPPAKKPKHDVSDRVRNGAKLELVRDAKDGKVVREGSGMESSVSRVWVERDKRMAVANRGHLGFGVSYLDHALGAIMANDLVLLGAASGGGKTELARYIAMHNAGSGKRVHFLALEADETEIERRTKWGFLVDLVEKNFSANEAQSRAVARKLTYLDWIQGKIDRITGPYEREADASVQETLRTMQTFYRVKDFTVKDLERVFDEVARETDLLVLDHLHYVDHDDNDENRAQRVLVKRLRDLQQKHGKAVLAVAHTRKADSRADRIVPTLDDFMGTKHISGIVTKAVMLAAAYDQPAHEERHRWKTYIAPLKCRVDGSRARFVGLTTFDARRNVYEKAYQIGRLTDRGTKFEPLTARELPQWCDEDASNDLE